MIFAHEPPAETPLRAAISALYRKDETACLQALLAELDLADEQLAGIDARARSLVAEVRRRRIGEGGIDAFMHEYDLDSREGVVLMCLAEALLRIPDAETADRLIRDKLADADWDAHIGRSESLCLDLGADADRPADPSWTRATARRRSRRPAAAARGAQRRAGDPPGRGPGDAHPGPPVRAGPDDRRGAGARRGRRSCRATGIPTTCWAKRRAPCRRRRALLRGLPRPRSRRSASSRGNGRGPIDKPGISVKLSALHPRYE